MKTLIAMVLLTVLVVLCGVGLYKYHEETKREERERAEQALRDCWKNVAPGSTSGAALCKTLADRLAEK